MNAGQKQMLAIVGLIGVVLLAVWLGWRGATSANSNGGFKPAPILSPAQQIANSRALRSSIGASLIWDSMFGPIRVDYAYPIAKQNYDVTQRFQFHAGAF